MEVTVGNNEDEVLVSDFTVAELWHCLPLLLVEETFSYLTLQNGNRLFRASTDWKALLSRHALFNKGIVFFQLTKKRPERYWWSDEEKARLLWGDQLYLKSHTMDHFVCVEQLDIKHLPMDYGPICDKLVESHQPLHTFTLYRHRGFGSAWCLKSLRQMLLKKSMGVRFVDCLLDVKVSCFEYFSENNEWDYEDLDLFSWDLPLPRGNRSLDTETFQKLEGAIAADNSADHVCGVYNKWFVPGSLDELTALMWTYPADQYQWLQTCLQSLETIVNADVASLIDSTYKVYDEMRQTVFGPRTDESVKRMGLRWKDHDLDVVDCAFLARLLNMTPGVPKPPHDLPKDVTTIQTCTTEPSCYCVAAEFFATFLFSLICFLLWADIS